ncbi:preprotein translocase subunit YajC, partial [candidate division WOR-3 bacterium]|nr:preprotein translocase subunit YajC [candidate division WOR-3 bacterium]
LKKGNKVITSAGMLGEIKLIKDDIIHIEIAPKVEIKVLKSTVTKVIEDNADLKLNE